uniref:Uncharacterized protein n=1 Tax=Heliothis virescens TaxID=7102 RepID=A0A2A4JHB4_HELVI
MLSAAKVRIHGMQDDNWVIKDKINQYRGLIKLYERDRKIHEGDLAKQKKRYSRDIRQLRKEIAAKREELGVAVYGDRQFLRNAFQDHRRLQLTYMNSKADKVLESIHQENFNKRKQLDRIRYTKKKKMEQFRMAQLEAAEMRDRVIYEMGGKLPPEKKEQAVANYVQRANIKKNAALAIKVMYKKILDILKKDSSYFTVVLEALKLDCRAQGKCLMGATEMGQLAMEYLDDRKFEYNKLEGEIKENMKERERTLKLARREVAYLTDSFPHLIRKELEAAEMRDRVIYEMGGKLPPEKKEQAVANYVQRANIKKNAALAIKVMYKKILDILKKDSSYFTVVLEALKLDCRAQGKCLMGATEMGQLAMEYLDDRKFEYNKLEGEIKENMKERERTLKLARREVAYLTDSFPHLIRKEEATNLDDLYEDEDNGSSHSTHWELDEVMRTCKRLQKATLVSSFDQIILRLKEQRYQTTRLMMSLSLNLEKRDTLIEDRKHAMLMLDTLKNVGQERTSHFLMEKKQLQSQMDAESRAEQELSKSLDEKGRVIIQMKTSLQQINELLSCVGAPNVPRPFTDVPPAVQYALEDMLQEVPQLESDFEKLLATARQKLNVLIQAVAKMEVTPEIRDSAFQFYHQIVAREMRENFLEDVVQEGGLIEFEMEDPNVPNRAVIKLRSKQLVDAQVSEFDVVDTGKK